jgi:ligand-binding sensor domain-containing protein
LQDEKDFIWLPSQNGLYRFDGKQTTLFSKKEKGWSIPFNWIHNISEHNNQLLLPTEAKGMWLFDTETGEAKPINIKAETNTFYRAVHHKDSYYAISMAPQNLYQYDIKTQKTTVLAKNVNNRLLFKSDNRVYFNDNNRLYYIDSRQETNKVQQISVINENLISATSIRDTVVVASNNKLFSINDNNTIIQKNITSPITAITAYNDQKSILSINLLGEVKKRETQSLKTLESNFPQVEGSRYRTLLHDSSGVLWLGNSRGVKQYIEAEVKLYPVVFDTNISAIETEIYQQNVYLGSYGQGIHMFSPLTKELSRPEESINKNLSQSAKKTNDLLAVDKSLFIATFDGLWRYNKNKNETKKVPLFFKDKDFSDLILLKLRHEKNLLYIATDGEGLIIYDLNKNKVIERVGKNRGLSSGEVIDVLPLVSGDIWLATASGIDVFNVHTQKITNVIDKTTTKFISLLYADDKIFATTKGDGIQVYNRQQTLLAHFAKGVNFNYMSLIDDQILASAKPGLYKINLKSYQFSIITNTSNFFFTDNAFVFKDKSFIAHSAGILEIPRTTDLTFHPKVHISQTTISGKSYLLNKAIDIESGNDVITLDLASLDYRPGIEKKYSYSVNSHKWNQISGNQLTLTGLTSGNYHIEIKATNSLGQWSDYQTYTDITVAFPWYWTPKIRVIYGVTLFALILLGAWLLYLRSKSISHIHNILQNDIHNYGKTSMQVKRNVTAALTLINENEITNGKRLLQQCVDDLNIQHSLPEPNSLNGNNINEAISFFAEYLEGKYQVNLTSIFEITEDELDYELQADIYRVIYEAITSAILNGNGRRFKVVLQKFKSKIWLSISDDNQSFIDFNSKVNFNISMYYIRQIAKKRNGSINTFSEQGNASQLVLSLPIMHGN